MTDWIVPANLIRVIDGDTIVVTLDLGWKLYKTDHVRLGGINAPELSTVEGLKSRDYLNTLIKPNDLLEIRSHKLDKYGRCLATVMFKKVSINDLMLISGHAVRYMI